MQIPEAKWDFRTVCFYVRTHHNDLGDWISRGDVGYVRRALRARGCRELRPLANWEVILEEVN